MIIRLLDSKQITRLLLNPGNHDNSLTHGSENGNNNETFFNNNHFVALLRFLKYYYKKIDKEFREEYFGK